MPEYKTQLTIEAPVDYYLVTCCEIEDLEEDDLVFDFDSNDWSEKLGDITEIDSFVIVARKRQYGIRELLEVYNEYCDEIHGFKKHNYDVSDAERIPKIRLKYFDKMCNILVSAKRNK